mgnify:CR=1 FL=1
MEYVLPGFLLGTVGAFIGRGGVGKSYAGLEMSVMIATGADLLGLGEHRLGKVLYLSMEDPAGVIRDRIRAVATRLTGVQIDRLIENLDVRPLVGAGIDIMDDVWLSAIISQGAGSRLIVIDTFRRSHLKNENDSADMGFALHRLEVIAARTGAAVLYLHHSRKGSYYSDSDDQGASRGSSVLADHARWQCFLSLMTEEERKRGNVPIESRDRVVKLGIHKQNYGPSFQPRWCIRQDDGVLLAWDALTSPRNGHGGETQHVL